MYKTLQDLMELQDIDFQLQRLELSRGDLPQKVLSLQNDVEEIERKIVERETQNHDCQARRKTVIHETTVAKERLKKYQNQLYQVKTNREYDAMTLEIENCQAVIEQLEFETLELDEKIEELDKELAGLRESHHHLRETLYVQKEYLNKTLAKTHQQEEKLSELRQIALKKLPRPMLSTYERIRAARGGIALALLKNGACSECSSRIPPQRGVEIRMMNRLFLCEVCGRILIWREEKN